MSKRMTPWRDVATGRFAHVTQADIAQSQRDGSRKVFDRAPGYQRKTRDVWHVLVDYGQGWEHETTEASRADAVDQRKCYRENCPQYPTRIRKRRERITP